jgi:hypothetical protein
MFNENKKRQSDNHSVGRIVDDVNPNNVRIIAEVKEEYITCESKSFRTRKLKFLVDTGAQKNIIKISALDGRVIVNESDKRNIKGINKIPISTFGTARISISIQGATRVIKFDIVNDDFDIPEAGIIGRSFLKENRVHWDFEEDILSIPEDNKTKL